MIVSSFVRLTCVAAVFGLSTPVLAQYTDGGGAGSGSGGSKCSNSTQCDYSTTTSHSFRVKGKATGIEYDTKAKVSGGDSHSLKLTVPGQAETNPAPCAALVQNYCGNVPAGATYTVTFSKTFSAGVEAQILFGADVLVGGMYIGGGYETQKSTTLRGSDDNVAIGGLTWDAARAKINASIKTLRAKTEKEAEAYYASKTWDLQSGWCTCRVECFEDDGRRGGKWVYSHEKKWEFLRGDSSNSCEQGTYLKKFGTPCGGWGHRIMCIGA